MRTMTVAEYRPLLIEAIRSSIEDKWEPLAVDPNANVIFRCPLCKLVDLLSPKGRIHDLCPLYKDSSQTCSDGWKSWLNAGTEKEQKAAALKVLAELNAIDVESWIQTLIERNVLIP